MIGGLLLAVRALDAVVDPWLGRVMDRVFAAGQAWRVAAVATSPRCGGFCRAVLSRRRRLSSVKRVSPMAWPRQPWHLPIWATAPRRSCIKRGRSLAATLRSAHGSWLGARRLFWRAVSATVLPAIMGWPALACLPQCAGGNCIGRAAWRASPASAASMQREADAAATAGPTKSPWRLAGVSSPHAGLT